MSHVQGLRQAPPQRVLFQPDVSSSRQTRNAHGQLNSPQPVVMGNHNYNYSSSASTISLPLSIANYEPRPPNPLTLRPITTPGNNPSLFKERQKQLRDARLIALGKAPPHSMKGMMKPGRKYFSLPGKVWAKSTQRGLMGPTSTSERYRVCEVTYRKNRIMLYTTSSKYRMSVVTSISLRLSPILQKHSSSML